MGNHSSSGYLHIPIQTLNYLTMMGSLSLALAISYSKYLRFGLSPCSMGLSREKEILYSKILTTILVISNLCFHALTISDFVLSDSYKDFDHHQFVFLYFDYFWFLNNVGLGLSRNWDFVLFQILTKILMISNLCLYLETKIFF